MQHSGFIWPMEEDHTMYNLGQVLLRSYLYIIQLFTFHEEHISQDNDKRVRTMLGVSLIKI